MGPYPAAVFTLIDGWRARDSAPDSGPREGIGCRRDGTHFPMDIAISNMAVDSHKQYIMCVRDITERKQAEEALEHQALHDLLTGLPNRVLLHDRLDQALMTARQHGEPLALLIVDLAWLAPTTSGIGIVIVLTGVPVYFFWRKSAAA